MKLIRVVFKMKANPYPVYVKNALPFLFICYFLLSFTIAFAGKKNWTIDPFEQKLFIENKGQFNNDLNKKEVVFYASVSGMDVYFTPQGVHYTHNNLLPDKKLTKKLHRGSSVVQFIDEEDVERHTQLKKSQFEMTWIGSNPHVNIIGIETASTYFTYSSPNKSNEQNSLIAKAYKKIKYLNLYPNIDVEYFLPNEGGLKYNIILHPGADISLVKMKYLKSTQITKHINGDLILNGEIGLFEDHAPKTFYADGRKLNSSFSVNSNVVSFEIRDNKNELINHVKETIIIDPWVTTPNFQDYDASYDINHDVYGNVYVYGSYGPYKLAKLDSLGNVLWIYTAIGYGLVGNTYTYGDLTVDENTGECYLSERELGGAPVSIRKINTSGALSKQYTLSTQMAEATRLEFDRCTNKVVIGGGNPNTSGTNYSYATIDTSLTTVNYYYTNITTGNDIAMLEIDRHSNNYFMFYTKSQLGYLSLDNALTKADVSNLNAYVFNVPTQHKFVELSTILYVGNKMQAGLGCNGLTASSSFVYTYDGDSIKRFDKNTGGLLSKAKVGNSVNPFLCSGLSHDDCDNVYVGMNNAVAVLDPVSMAISSTFAMPDKVFDVEWDHNKGNKLYVCGKGFVSSIDLQSNFSSLNVLPVVTNTSSCLSSDGAITLNAAVSCGAPGSLQYLWSPGGETTQTITGLSSGVYTVTLTGLCNLKRIIPIKVEANGGIVTSTIATNAGCVTAGSITVSATGGNSNYTYSWSSGISATTNAVSGLSAGTYSVTVTDNGGCEAKDSAIVVDASSLFNVSENHVDEICTTKGSATISVTGNNGPLSYMWSGLGLTTASASNLSAGNYSVTIADSVGCDTAIVVSITSVPTISITASSINITCHGDSDGIINLIPTGGLGAYSYSWLPNVSSSISASGLNAGDYTIIVSDSNDCADTVTLKITEPQPLEVSFNSQNTYCNKNNGQINAFVTGGTSPYLYSWQGGETSALLNSLDQGEYIVVVTDKNNCSIKDSITLTEVPGPIISLNSQSDITCNGFSNGSVSVAVSSGTSPFVYSWSSLVNTGNSVNNLNVGTYTVTVTDINNCSQSLVATITEPTALSSVVQSTSTSCSINTGTAAVASFGGVQPYFYSWSNGATGNSLSGLSQGSYSVVVTDNNGCSKKDTVVVLVSDKPQPAILNSQSVSCFNGSNGSATITTSNGTLPYSYSWVGINATDSSISGLQAGTYTVIVADQQNCSASITLTITQPSALSILLTPTNASCITVNNGSVISTVSGGVGPYTYTWSNSAQNSTIGTLPVGSYSVVVSDANGCSKNASVLVGADNGPAIFVSPDVTIAYGEAVEISVNSAASYLWSPSTNLSCSNCQLAIASPTTSMWYNVTITDSYGCTAVDSVYIEVEPPCGEVFVPSAFSPNGDGINDHFFVRGNCIEDLLLQVFDRWGELVFETSNIAIKWDGSYRGKDLDAGVFVYQLSGRLKKSIEPFYLKGNVTLVR